MLCLEGQWKTVVMSVTASDEEEQNLGKVQAEQHMDHKLAQLIEYLEQGVLPIGPAEAQRIVRDANQGYFLVDGVLYFESPDLQGRQ